MYTTKCKIVLKGCTYCEKVSTYIHFDMILFRLSFVCFVALHPNNSYGHGGIVSSPDHTFSWVSWNKRLTSTSHFCCSKVKNTFPSLHARYKEITLWNVLSFIKFTFLVERAKCEDPSELNVGVEMIDVQRYKLLKKSKMHGDMKRDGYYDWDVIEYRCKKG